MTEPGASIIPAFLAAIACGDFTVPVYPAAAMRLRKLMAGDKYSVTEVCDVVASDPALAATILRLANSPLFRPDGAPINTLGRAVHRIGMRSLGALATAAGVGTQACARGPLVDLKFAVWRRSITAALICQKLAPARGLDPEEAFLAGLLYGFGRTVAAACLEKLLAAAPTARPLSPGEWFALFDQHRAAIAQVIAERWELPQGLAAAIGAGPESNLDLARLLAVAEELGQAIDFNLPVDSARLNDQERVVVRDLCQALPGAISALVEVPDGKRPPAPSAIAKPVTALKGEVRQSSVPISDARGNTGKALRAVALSADGARLLSERPFQEASMAHFVVNRAGKPLSIWVSVVLCVPEAQQFRVEIQLFAPSRELRAEWLEVFQTAPA